MSRRHDHDAGGDAGLLAAKAALRERVWASLDVAGIRRFPGPWHRIPNFVGAEAAAECLRSTRSWQDAQHLKANPDSPQLPVRQRALEDGRVVYMAVPRLAEPEPFFLLDPDHLADPPRRAASIAGATRSGRTVPLEGLAPVDLVVTGCVAVGEDGVRLGKGGGFSDLEFAIASEAGLIGPTTRVATTVHPAQIQAAGEIPSSDHDVHVDVIATPDEVLEVPRRAEDTPARLRREELTEEKVAAIPVLAALQQRARNQRGEGR